MRRRTRARELALQALYQLDLRGPEVLGDLERLISQGAGEPEVREFARCLVDGCRAHAQTLDAHIRAVAEHWDIARMAIVDRNILRLAAYEILFLDEVPPNVAINEAVELAKRYSTADSGAFVNGILDRIRREGERQAERAAPT